MVSTEVGAVEGESAWKVFVRARSLKMALELAARQQGAVRGESAAKSRRRGWNRRRYVTFECIDAPRILSPSTSSLVK